MTAFALSVNEHYRQQRQYWLILLTLLFMFTFFAPHEDCSFEGAVLLL